MNQNRDPARTEGEHFFQHWIFRIDQHYIPPAGFVNKVLEFFGPIASQADECGQFEGLDASLNRCGFVMSLVSIFWSKRNGFNDCFKVWSMCGFSMISSQK